MLVPQPWACLLLLLNNKGCKYDFPLTRLIRFKTEQRHLPGQQGREQISLKETFQQRALHKAVSLGSALVMWREKCLPRAHWKLEGLGRGGEGWRGAGWSRLFLPEDGLLATGQHGPTGTAQEKNSFSQICLQHCSHHSLAPLCSY